MNQQEIKNIQLVILFNNLNHLKGKPKYKIKIFSNNKLIHIKMANQ